MPSLAFTADSRQTEAGRLYNRSEEDETRIPLQKAIDDADYEHGHRVNELRACCVKGSDELLKLNTHTIPASGFRVSIFFKARRVCGSNGEHTR